jgi:oligoendopeptidase F
VLERGLLQKATQRLDETLAQIQAAASWTCSDGTRDAGWQRLASLADRTMNDIKLALAKYG